MNPIETCQRREVVEAIAQGNVRVKRAWKQHLSQQMNSPFLQNRKIVDFAKADQSEAMSAPPNRRPTALLSICLMALFRNKYMLLRPR